MANSNSSNESYLRLANIILEELIMREFSKRQRKIIDLILRLSWGCNRPDAVITELKYFTLCGIHRQDVKKELEFLHNNRVITWKREMNLFEFNRNFDEWIIPYSRFFNKKLLKELVSMNLSSQNIYRGSKTLPECEKSASIISKKDEFSNCGEVLRNSISIPSITNSYKEFIYQEKYLKLLPKSIEATKILIEEKKNIRRSSPLDFIRTREDALNHILSFPENLRCKIFSNIELMNKYNIKSIELSENTREIISK